MSKYITIPFNAVFLDTIAQKWMEEMHSQGGYPCGMVIVPNQRTVKALINSFIKVNKGKPLLLPKIISIGTIDEAGLSFNSKEELTLFPAVHPVKRLSILTSLIIQMNHELGNQIQAGEAWNLAKSLADLMDEAEWIGCNLKTALSKAVEDEYAQHWQNILKFLSIITEIWPQWLQDNQLMNPVARVIALLKAQAKSWRNSGCQDPVWVVGFADARPVIVEFLSTVVQLPRGRLIVSGLQEDLSEESWNALPITHPYAELVKMFLALGIKRSDFQYWDHICVQPICKERISAFQQILLPADRLESWLINRRPVQLDQCFLIEPLNQQQEAIAIALMIRDALEIPQKRIALVTPDRNLAMRVSLELGRWGVIADDSAGEPLYKTAGAVFLNLILQACVEDFTPLSLLSLLKHPFACCGLPASLCRDYSRLLEIFILRQFAASGLSVIQAALKRKIEEIKLLDKDTLRTDIAYFFSNSSELVSLLDRLKQNVQTLLGKTTKYTVGEWVTYLARAAEQLASNQEQNGEDILWKAEEGNALAEHLRDLIVETEYIKVVTLSEFASIFRASFQGLIVHTRRALQGREVRQLHPRVYIWGLLEARLQNVDMVILGGLSEGVWPPSIDSGSWLSRPMREKMGMGLPDIEIGRTAYAFMALCCSIPEVILSSPLRQENAPVVQSRWIVRLKAWLKGRKSVIQQHPALMWIKYLDQPDGSPTPMECPSPKPLPALRPKSISITDVERWIKDPYEIYAKKILNLRKIVGLEEDRSTSIFGLIVHEGLKNVYENYSKQWTLSGIEQTLLDALDKRQDILISYKKWWHARLLKIAHWVYQQEKSRRNSRMLPQFYLEKEGHYYFQLTAGIDFTLRGIADRIQLNTDGTVEIYDYKTGVTPACINVKNGLFPQLPLEAAMAYYGGFDKSLAEHEISKFTYWELKGGIEEGKEIHIDNIQKEGDATNLSERYWQVLQKLIIAYCDQEQPYLSCPRPHLIKEYVQTLPVFGDYKHLARFLEWGLGTGGS
ncbi:MULTISPECIES: double-strand break repair protein AddB [unclassified Commensalibacter]|uniref:double-strand break repair protein AddB n=1 Tax=unclassified Commensalibacter TaxID=2630218 RepID=UPI0018DBAB41|nr:MULTISPECIES: double-strand break repair protein AddB [unclassified Commensalibacter]MBH9969020.1 double-strand break repair protein AddB [Commensalibacter sp. M0265]MBH9976376.1 double-strand break repair protein AddB [Commensalibacter sp. M0266]MBH9992688.1 double-strand break repair protein AddB [Commensalibacter sp. M0270]MBI0045552.1 double-strand break repair protein AddB [Commensalibacter sp. M0267]MBI0055221.1 double-strand break repair protein AddB [Commensalibacter sp. M0268]